MRPALIDWLQRHGFTIVAPFVPTSAAVYLGVFVLIGVAGWQRAQRTGLTGARAIDFLIVGGIGAVLGARIYYLLLHLERLHTPADAWFSSDGGTGSWGAYLGIAIAFAAFAAVRRIPLWPWLDLVASLQPAGEALGRWACWLAGDDFGRATTVPWAIRFPPGSFAWQAQVAEHLIPPNAPASLPVHPFQLYLVANALMLAFIITAFWHRTRNRPGFTLAVLLVAYGASRFGWEFLRDPAAGGARTGLSSSQWMCLACLIAGGVLLVLRRAVKQAPPLAAASVA